MIVKLKEKNVDYPDLTPAQPYVVIGIEADDYSPSLNTTGFIKDFFDGDEGAVSQFWRVLNQHLTIAGWYYHVT